MPIGNLAYRHGRKSIREAYEDHFSAVDTREVTVHRVVNIVERRSPVPRTLAEYDRRLNDDQWYCGLRNYHNTRECHGEGSYPPSDRQYFDENPNYGNFRRNSPPPRNGDLYSQQCYSRDDLRHHLGSRNSGRTGPYSRSRGRGSGPHLRSLPDRKAESLPSHPHGEDHDKYRTSPPVVSKRERSPGRRETQPPVRSGSNTSSRSFSPDTDKGYIHHQAQKKYKPSALMSHTPSSSVEGSPRSSASSKEKTSASVVETEEVVAASMEPKLTPEEDFKACRLEAIKAKALEIEKHYRQDCETFRTVVKMLVAKDPSLENLLQAPLHENLLETKQRCLDALRHFVKELDETITRGGDGANHGSLQTSSTNHPRADVDFPQLCSPTPTSTDGKQGGRKQTGNTGDAAPVPTGNQGGKKQSGNTEDSIPVPEIYRPGSQENLVTPGPEDGHSELMDLLPNLSESPAPSAQQTRLQLYNHKGEKFSYANLSNPKTWKDIAYARPGWIPDHLPYLQPGYQYWELKANSTVVSTGTPPIGKGPKKVGCGVTFYNHVEGPWCEVQSENGTRICILAAPPQYIPPLTAQITRLMGQGQPEHNARDGVRRGPRVHSASVPYSGKQKGEPSLRD